MRKFIGTSLLVLALSLSAHAGEMPFGVTNPPPPPQTTASAQELPDDGETPFDQQATAEAVLSLLGGVLALF